MSLQKMPPDRALTFSERHLILKQAWDDALELSVQQIGLPSVMTGAALFTSWWLGQITSWTTALIPLLVSLGVGLLFYVLIAIIRAPFIVIRRYQQQIAGLNQSLLDAETRLLSAAAATQALPTATLQPALEPNIVCLGAPTLLGYKDENGIYWEGAREDTLLLVAEFCNQSRAEVEPPIVENVEARIVYDKPDWNGFRVDHGTWIEEELNYTTLFPDNPRQLIIAATVRKGLFFTIENNRTTNQNKSLNELPLESSYYDVEVKLQTKSKKELAKFRFRLTLEPKPELIPLLD